MLVSARICDLATAERLPKNARPDDALLNTNISLGDLDAAAVVVALITNETGLEVDARIDDAAMGALVTRSEFHVTLVWAYKGPVRLMFVRTSYLRGSSPVIAKDTSGGA